MPRQAGRDLYVRQLRAAKASRYSDLCVEFVDERDQSVLFRVGGVWDLSLREWADREPETSLQVRLHPGQIEAATWFRLWFEAYLSGDSLGLAIYSVLLIGGTRAGKTHLALWMTIAFMVAVPGARVWIVQEVDIERGDELSTELDELLPADWFRKSANKYHCLNGTVATIRSAKYPAKLKRGRCDWAFLNEGQNVTEAAHLRLRERTSDTSGLVVTAANPPDANPDGEWVNDFHTECQAGRRPNARSFHFDPRDNPHVNREQLEALATETDPRTYAIEVLGESRPPSNAVMHAFDPIFNIDSVPELGDVTAQFVHRQGMGKGVQDVVALDFQRAPHMAGTRGRLFTNPDDVARPLLYWFEEFIVDLGDEYDLSDALYDAGLSPAATALIPDASGDWQDANRTGHKIKQDKKNNSFELLRECGWTRIFKPDRNLEGNPRIDDRMKNDNRLFLAQDGSRIVRIDPACITLIESCKKWRRKNGVPDRRSKHAHVGDCMSYGNWRLYPRRVTSGRVGYKRIKGRQRSKQMRGY